MSPALHDVKFQDLGEACSRCLLAGLVRAFKGGS